MKRATCIALVLGLALAPVSLMAQLPSVNSGTQPAAIPTVPVDQQATKEQIARLFEAVKIKEQLASVSKMMPTLMQQQFSEQMKQMQKDHPEMKVMTDEQQKDSAKVMAKFMERVMTVYSSDDMLNEMGAIYQKYLTGADVEAIITFYNTPAGQHMLSMAPAMMQEFMPTMMKHMQERIKPLIEDMSKEMEAIVKTTPGASANAGSKQIVAPDPQPSTPAGK
jgi:hypothetical protein